jgi:hypothetical protein
MECVDRFLRAFVPAELGLVQTCVRIVLADSAVSDVHCVVSSSHFGVLSSRSCTTALVASCACACSASRVCKCAARLVVACLLACWLVPLLLPL